MLKMDILLLLLITYGNVGIADDDGATGDGSGDGDGGTEPFILDVLYPGGENLEVHARRIAEMGVNHLTVLAYWARIEPRDDEYDLAPFDAQLAVYAESGVGPRGIVIDWWNAPPEWLGTSDEHDPGFQGELLQFVEDMSRRYGPTIPYWEIGNELNGLNWKGSVRQEDVDLYRAVSAAAREGCRTVKVGTRLAFDSFDTGIANWAGFCRGIEGCYDWLGINVYPFGYGKGPEDGCVQDAVLLAGRFSGKPVWVTETAASSLDVSEEERARYVRNGILDAYRAGAIGVSIYAYKSDGDGYALINMTRWYLDKGFDPTPAYFAYRDAVAELTS